MSLFKKKNKKKKPQFYDENLNIELEYENLKKNSGEDREFKNIEDMQHVRIQCEQIAESSKYIAELKKESLEVQKYIDDIQNIENCPENLRKKITDIAKKTEKLEKKCYDIHSREQNLSRERTAMFVRYENEFPKALVNLQNDEKYFQAVKHDMRMLEAEKISLKEDMKMYQDRTGKVKNGAVIFLFVILVIFVLFFVSGQLNNAGGRNLFFAVLFCSMLLVAIIFLVQRNSLYQFRLCDKKMARAVTLLNKTKIKYVNIAGSVDYQYEKYGVKNSYQLSREYEAFLNDKKNSEKYRESLKESDESRALLRKTLEKINLSNADLWENQYMMLADEEELLKIKNRVESRYEKLKEQIKYNLERIDKSKKYILEFVKKHPDKSDVIMEMVDSYEL